MTRDSVRARINEIVSDREKPVVQQVRELEAMHEDIRAQQRAATESAMVDDQDLGSALKEIEQALEKLGGNIEGPEDRGPATL